MYSRFYVVFAVAALLSSLLYPFSAAAQTCGQDCTTPPTCSQLGYKKDIYCPDGFITCPFDTSYKWCKEYTCEDGRYYSSPLTGDYTCSKAEYHGLTCYDCVAAVEEDICSAYDEQTLVEALQCADCPVITVLNDISITDKLPDLKEGQTLKAADGQTYTISVNPSGDIQTSDPEFEISQDGQTMKMKLSQLFGAAPGIILTTAAGSRIDNIHFKVAATHNVDAVIVPLGDTTFNNLSIVIDGKDEENKRFLTAGVLSINPSGHLSFKGDTYIEMKNIKGRQMAGGVLDFLSMASPETAASITVDNIDILQENINSENLFGLISSNLDVTGDIEITQSDNKDMPGNLIAITAEQLHAASVTIHQENNISTAIWEGVSSAEKLVGLNVNMLFDTPIIINQTNNQNFYFHYGIHSDSSDIHCSFAEVNQINNIVDAYLHAISMRDLSSSNNGHTIIADQDNAKLIVNQIGNKVSSLRGFDDVSATAQNATLNVTQKQNIFEEHGSISCYVNGASPSDFYEVNVIQEENSWGDCSGGNFHALSASGSNTNITIRQQNNVLHNLDGMSAYTFSSSKPSDPESKIEKIDIIQSDNDIVVGSQYFVFHGLNAQLCTVQTANITQTQNIFEAKGSFYIVGALGNINELTVIQNDLDVSTTRYIYSCDIIGVGKGTYQNINLTQDNIRIHNTSTKKCYVNGFATSTNVSMGNISVENAIIKQNSVNDSDTVSQCVFKSYSSSYNVIIDNADVKRQCSELKCGAYPNNIIINNLTDNYTPCE